MSLWRASPVPGFAEIHCKEDLCQEIQDGEANPFCGYKLVTDPGC
jgi:hypothetical protein